MQIILSKVNHPHSPSLELYLTSAYLPSLVPLPLPDSLNSLKFRARCKNVFWCTIILLVNIPISIDYWRSNRPRLRRETLSLKGIFPRKQRAEKRLCLNTRDMIQLFFGYVHALLAVHSSIRTAIEGNLLKHICGVQVCMATVYLPHSAKWAPNTSAYGNVFLMCSGPSLLPWT